MRELRERIMADGWRPIEGSLLFSHKQVELTAAPGETAEGSFTITGTAGERTEGFVRAQDERMQCMTEHFFGETETVEYRFNASGMQDGETRSGHFFVISNCGEFDLPWKVCVRAVPPTSSLGEIRNLFHFTNLARANWQEAVNFFYTKECRRICGEEKEELFNLYRGFSRNLGNELNVEEFLVAVNKKQPVGFSVQPGELHIPESRGHMSEEIRITRTCWGPVRIRVEVTGDFLNVDKSWLGEDDFLGNQCRMAVFLDGDRMHAGRNFGQVTLIHAHGRMEIPVTAMKSRLSGREKAGRYRELKKENLRMVQLYQQMRMKRIGIKEWRSSAGECAERMAALADKSIVPRLFTAQLLLTEEKREEAGRILERAAARIRETGPAVYCYYLYLTTLYRQDEAYVQKAVRRVEQVFAQNPGEWRIAWLLLFLSRDLNRNPQKKWQFLEERFLNGCTSPVLYLEALLLLNTSPTLILKLDRTAKQILMYGAKNRILSPDLTGHVLYLANREKYYDPVLFTVLKHIWEDQKDTETLQAICTLLVKGQKTGEAYFAWYERGVKKKLRITRLYEYYLMSADIDREREIPKSVLLYFAYQSNLDYAYAAYLYAYVEKRREEEPDLYIAYRAQIDRFVPEQIYKGRLNRDLAYLYRTVFMRSDPDPEQAKALAAMFSCVELSWQGEAKKLVVVHARLKGEKSYVIRNGRAYVDLYGREDMIFAEDAEKNRRLINGEVTVRPLLGSAFLALPKKEADEAAASEVEALRQKVAPWAKDVLSFQLAVTDEKQAVVRHENAESYLTMVQEPVLTGVYGRKVRGALIRFFYEEGYAQGLDILLSKLQPEDVDAADRDEIVRYLVLQGLYEKAYEWLWGMDFDRQDARILLRLCSRLLEQPQYAQQERMTMLCFSAAVRGKYDGAVLQQLNDRYEGSIGAMEALKGAAEGFGINTYPLCERIMEQMLYTQRDVTERMDLLRQYASEGGRIELEIAFLHRCAYSHVMEQQPIHVAMIHEILRLSEQQEPLTDMCTIACLLYFARNRAAMDEKAERIVKRTGSRLLSQDRILPVIKEFQGVIPGAEFLQDKTFVVFRGDPARQAVLHYRVLTAGEGQQDYQSIGMQHVYEGIFVRTFILFPGESLQYYVVEADSPEKIRDSGMRLAEECTEAAQKSRYGELYGIYGQLFNGQQEKGALRQGIERAERYLHTDFCVDRLFRAKE